jgi:hypothetical protein
MIYSITDSDVYVSPKQEKNLNLFWYGFILFQVSYTLSTLPYVNILHFQALQFLGAVIFMYAAANIIRMRVKDNYLKSLFIVYFLWLMGVLARGFSADFFFMKELFFDAGYGLFAYLTPLFLLFPLNFAYFRKLFWTILVLSVFHLLLTLIFIKDIFNPDRLSTLSQGIVEYFTSLGFSITFILLTYIYHKPKQRMFALFMAFFSFLCIIYRARRGWIFMHLTTLLSVLIIYLIASKRTAMVAYVAVIMALFGYLYFSSLYNQTNFGIFNFLVERGDEDTRTGVEDLFYEDMSTTDLLIGRGIRGEYYCPNIDVLDTRGYRSVIETGYLQIVLKGGWISLVLLLMILIPGCIKGLFKSKNILCKAFGFQILLWMMYLYPTVGNSFTMQYILVWIGVAVCYSKKIRNMSDDEISEYLMPLKKVDGTKRLAKVIPQPST